MKVVQTRIRRGRWAGYLSMVSLALSLTVGTNNAQAAPEITSPTPGTTLTGSTETFSWAAGGSVVTEWWLYVRTNPGERDVYNSKSLGTATSDTVTVLPTNGATLYVRLWYRVDGEWRGTNFTYTAFASSGSSGGLSAVPPWDQALPVAERFVVVLGGAAVLDKGTGLVWQQSPTLTQHTWFNARTFCLRTPIGGHMGWRLPSTHELASLVDPSQSDPALPTGSTSFFNVPLGRYWSATTDASDPTMGWAINISGGMVDNINKTIPNLAWCVRGAGPLAVY